MCEFVQKKCLEMLLKFFAHWYVYLCYINSQVLLTFVSKKYIKLMKWIIYEIMIVQIIGTGYIFITSANSTKYYVE